MLQGKSYDCLHIVTETIHSEHHTYRFNGFQDLGVANSLSYWLRKRKAPFHRRQLKLYWQKEKEKTIYEVMAIVKTI